MPTLLLDSEADCADDLFMFVRCKKRRKDGKEHRYWSVVENVRVRSGRVVQRQVLYLGEINRNGPRELDSAVSGIFLGFQAAKSR